MNAGASIPAFPDKERDRPTDTHDLHHQRRRQTNFADKSRYRKIDWRQRLTEPVSP